MSQNQKKAVSNKFGFLLLAIIFLAFILFISRIKKYGVSFDEYYFYQYAELNLRAIFSHISGLSFDQLVDFYDLKYYGSAYIIFGEYLIEKVQNFYPQLDIYHAWHTLNFVTFLSGAWIIYTLSKRFVGELSSFFTALLYLTQPLLWGHGIMNPKDTSFMVFFLAAVTIGIVAVDKIVDCKLDTGQTRNKPFLQFGHKKATTFFLSVVIIMGLVNIVLLVDRISSNAISHPIVSNFFMKIESSNTGSLLYSIKQKIDAGVSNGIPISSYFDKTYRIINGFEFYFISLSFILIAFFVLVKSSSAVHWSIFAAFLLGLTMAIRILGPAAGGLVGLYALLRLGKKSWRFLLIYAGVAILIMYLFWPRLWIDPINRYIEAFKVMANFPWPGAVRFQGGEYLATQLPWYYLPKLISIQFTLPLLLLMILGLILIIKNRFIIDDWRKTVIVLCWFFIPFIAVIILHPTMYDNFRQFLFIIPPLFIFAGISFEKLTGIIANKHILNCIIVLSLLPGIIAGFWLHPYEYIYYNALVGWTGNVERKYEADYWNTSFCEAAQFLSDNAKEGAKIAFTDTITASIFLECTEKEFEILVERQEYTEIFPDYSVVSTRYDDDIDYFRSMKPEKLIARGDTPFLVIKSK